MLKLIRILLGTLSPSTEYNRLESYTYIWETTNLRRIDKLQISNVNKLNELNLKYFLSEHQKIILD